MQETRRCILDILKKAGQSTVDGIVEQLQTQFKIDITAVTVRHHLGILQEEGYITEPELRHRNSPGRPQHVYMLTEKAFDALPNNYRHLMTYLVKELEEQLPSDEINVIFDGVAHAMTSRLPLYEGMSVHEKMDMITAYLNEQGYSASWENSSEGIVLYTSNCPYHHIAQSTDKLCALDIRLISALTGALPRRISSISKGDETCAYLIPVKSMA